MKSNQKKLKNIPTFRIILIISFLTLGLGCRGYRSEKPPIHLNPNMDFQAKIKAQWLPLDPPFGTIPWGDQSIQEEDPGRARFLKSDSGFYFGKTQNGQWLSRVPVEVTKTVVLRGQERFNIYCAVCHDRAGTGKGPVIERGFTPAPDYADERILKLRDGEIFNIITNGIRNMPAYQYQIREEDRWAIVTYVRALQKMRTAKKNELPIFITAQLK